MPRVHPVGSSRLSVDDWIREGYAIVAAGLKALKIDRLCDRLGVTKGSFYWYFTDMPIMRSRPACAPPTVGCYRPFARPSSIWVSTQTKPICVRAPHLLPE
jgi:Bacterial regulatory proteins, tetR family